MQCKDIPDRPVLEFLMRLPINPHDPAKKMQISAGWHDLHPRREFCPTVVDAMPQWTPRKLVLAKMKALHRRGLVSGCTCGCRGDFELTDKGRQALAS